MWDVFVGYRYAFRKVVHLAVHFYRTIAAKCSRNAVSIAFWNKSFSLNSSCYQEIDNTFGSSLAQCVVGYSQKRTRIGVWGELYDVCGIVYQDNQKVGKRVLVLIFQFPLCKVVSYFGKNDRFFRNWCETKVVNKVFARCQAHSVLFSFGVEVIDLRYLYLIVYIVSYLFGCEVVFSASVGSGFKRGIVISNQFDLCSFDWLHRFVVSHSSAQREQQWGAIERVYVVASRSSFAVWREVSALFGCYGFFFYGVEDNSDLIVRAVDRIHEVLWFAPFAVFQFCIEKIKSSQARKSVRGVVKSCVGTQSRELFLAFGVDLFTEIGYVSERFFYRTPCCNPQIVVALSSRTVRREDKGQFVRTDCRVEVVICSIA